MAERTTRPSPRRVRSSASAAARGPAARPPIDRDEQPEASTTIARRWAYLIARHRRLVLVLWALALVAAAFAYPALDQRLEAPDFTADNAESTTVDRLIADHFPQVGPEQDLVVFDSSGPQFQSDAFRSAVTAALDVARATDGVASVIAPLDNRQISADRTAAFAIVGLSGDTAHRADTAAELEAAFADLPGTDVTVSLVGYSPIQNAIVDTETRDVERAEMFGVPVAFALLVLALGALVAALIPVSVALAGILACLGVLFVLSHTVSLPSLVVSIATMIGTGIGIDYAMFVVSRFREELVREGVAGRRDQAGIAAALGTTLETTGKTILASGLIVVIALCSLLVVGSPIFRAIALGVATAVICTLLVGLTLLPALLATLGPAVDRGALPDRFRPGHTRPDRDAVDGGWARWARTVMRRPIAFGAAASALLLLAAYPLTDIEYGLDMGLPALADTRTGHGMAVLDAKFEPGLLSPLEIIITGPNEGPLRETDLPAAQQFVATTQERADVVTAVVQTVDGRMLVTAIPSVSFDTTEAADLVRGLRTSAEQVSGDDGPSISVGGASAEFVDASAEITAKFPWVIGLVLLSSLLFLIVVFRSILLPLKAIAINLLATGAALGITVAIFQWGWGSSVLDFHSVGFLQVFLPTIVFAMLFGLSMDYEVFLIRRMKERWDSGEPDDPHRNETAVCEGIEHTARPITAAAAIMVVIFGSFVTADVLELKQIGLALAVAITIDAVVVRLVLVPALMRLFGPWNWWLPGRTVRGIMPMRGQPLPE